MTLPARLLGPDETILRDFRPHWHYLLVPMLLTVIYLLLFVATLVYADGSMQTFLLILLTVFWLILSLGRFLGWYFTGYTITTERVIVRSGVFSRKGKEIPLEVINDVAFHRNLFERIIGSGDLLIESAGELGQSYYTDIPQPELIQSEILRARESRTIALEHGGAPATEQSNTLATEIKELHQLYTDGIITEVEFNRQKQRLMNSQ